jgi:hypothetical protein
MATAVIPVCYSAVEGAQPGMTAIVASYTTSGDVTEKYLFGN